MKNRFSIGLDIGSTTAKIVVLNADNDVVFSKYERHNADVIAVVREYFVSVFELLGSCEVSINITGSVGMGVAEMFNVSFVQEVVAATKYSAILYPEISTMIDIGGEDAKVVYFNRTAIPDLRMNGNCAGGTGAFIDQMAIILGIDIEEMDRLAAQSTTIYPIASRCGVFSKTDVQTLLSNNIPKSDAAASIFHAVAVQTISTLAKGNTIAPKILLCGGPLTFISSLRAAFCNYLNLSQEAFVVPKDAFLIPAYGAALCCNKEQYTDIASLMTKITSKWIKAKENSSDLQAMFDSEKEYEIWCEKKKSNDIVYADIASHEGESFLGIDSGSTTTKIVLVDSCERILFSYYAPNNGNPIKAVSEGLQKLSTAFAEAGSLPNIQGCCSTGYGEDLIKAAFNLDYGIIETIAHYIAAKKIKQEVSFILDIGGQDMKAIFIENGILSRMEINEACSSGCGTFIETFARSMNRTIDEFAHLACFAKFPSDLGTRCTVFMNSKVKQSLREGADVEDIAAGLSYSVVKNCLFKVLKFKSIEELGSCIVVQGGTMKNDSVVRALELLVGSEVYRSNSPELMGALGCALYAKNRGARGDFENSHRLEIGNYRTEQIQCKGCENRCYINRYVFANKNLFFSGNKCECIFSNKGDDTPKGLNTYSDKYSLLFERGATINSGITVGIPRCLNMYEEYPFWFTLFEQCGINTLLSSTSSYVKYEKGLHTVMSDNICFPAKLVHSHIYELIERKVDRIFFPFVLFEQPEGSDTHNSFNCPIVTGYSELIKSAIAPDIPIDSPIISFKDRAALTAQCTSYFASLGVSKNRVKAALDIALAEQERYRAELVAINRRVLQKSRNEGRLTILLAGRPYHTDPLVQHQLADMIASMGINVITDDIVRGDSSITMNETYMISQWAYINRILKSAKWVASQGNDIHYVQMTSFGCGPDAFLLDEVKSILNRAGKALTILKIDDINNIGSLKLRVRSVVESIKFNTLENFIPKRFVTTKIFDSGDKRRKIIGPFFTEYVSPLMPSFFKLAGYDFEILPESDRESSEIGLQFANNEVCYPAILVVGDIIKALRSGQYDLSNTAVAMSQTGGQCRATNYIALIKKALADAGFAEVPVVSVALGGLVNEQPGFKIDWLSLFPIALATLLYSDCIAKFYNAAVVRERNRGEALQMRELYLDKAKALIARKDSTALYSLIGKAADDFSSILKSVDPCPKVGIVGEIYLKFNAFAHKQVTNWFIDKKIEVQPPILLDFFLQAFVNRKINAAENFKKTPFNDFLFGAAYSLIKKRIDKVNKIASRFPLFVPFNDIFAEANHGKEIISLSVQFGEGWLLPAEIVSFAKRGVNNVVSLQPFGCIANHIISKGMEKKIKSLYPQMNLLSLDFDSGVSDTNIVNRLLLFAENIAV